MFELNEVEIEEISGGFMKYPGPWLESFMRGLESVFDRLPHVYSKAIDATSEIMCRGTGNC